MPNISLEGYLEILGIVTAFAAAWIFYRKSLPKVDLSYTMQTTELLGGSKSALPQEIEILFDGKQIKDLHKVNCVFWNGGTETIRKTDLVTSKPPSVSFGPGLAMLKPSILRANDPDSGVTVVKGDGRSVTMTFDFLEPMQGFNVEILYTGGDTAPDVTGRVIGMKSEIRKRRVVALDTSEGAVRLNSYLFGFLMALIAMVLGLTVADGRLFFLSFPLMLFVRAGFIGGFVLLALLLTLFYNGSTRRRRMPAALKT